MEFILSCLVKRVSDIHKKSHELLANIRLEESHLDDIPLTLPAQHVMVCCLGIEILLLGLRLFLNLIGLSLLSDRIELRRLNLDLFLRLLRLATLLTGRCLPTVARPPPPRRTYRRP